MIPSATAYAVSSEITSPRWAEAFSIGCKGAYIREGQSANLQEGPAAFFGSAQLWPLLTQCEAEGRTYYYGDHGYFGRHVYFRCTKNAKQITKAEGDDNSKRFEAFNIPIKPWRRELGGSHILLCPNSEAFLKLHGYAEGEWIKLVTAELRKYTTREIRLRWKSDATMKGMAFEAELQNCWAVVTFTSNAALEAILYGVPAFAGAPCAASPLALDDLSRIDAPYYPTKLERLRMACILANNQWTYSEYANGMAWGKLNGTA